MDQTIGHLKINFKGSYPSVQKMTISNLPEYAFIGRSNVGKSSLINMLSGMTQIAKVSKTPGKTQLINVFDVEGKWQIIDLPGYGYAKTARSERAAWSQMVEGYITKRENLACLFVLIDSRLPLQKLDSEFMLFCGKHQIPIAIVYTKTDKLTFNLLKKNILAIQNALKEIWSHLPMEFISSSVNKNGRMELLTFINETNEQYQGQSE